ncbi:MAG: mechanosensitive ion channel family protein [Bacteroidota bacterium]
MLHYSSTPLLNYSNFPLFDRILKYLGNPIISHIVASLLLLFGTLFVGWLIKRFLDVVGRNIAKRTKTEVDDAILDAILPRIKWIAFVVGSFLASDEVAKVTIKNPIAHQILGYTKGAIFVGLVFVVTVLLIQLTDVIVTHTIEKRGRQAGIAYDNALVLLLKRTSSSIFVLIACIMTLGHFGVDVSSLLVFLGGGSVAIALAAQDTLSNMIAGFVIMIDRPFRIGDRVRLPSGEIGDVYEIGIRSTKILDPDQNLIISPNAELVKAKMVNFSYPGHHIRIVSEVGVAYGTNLDVAKKMILSLARKHPDILSDPPPEVFTTALADSSVTLMLSARTDHFNKKFKIETELREHIYNAFLEEGIDIPFPQRVVHLSNGKTKTSSKRKALRR